MFEAAMRSSISRSMDLASLRHRPAAMFTSHFAPLYSPRHATFRENTHSLSRDLGPFVFVVEGYGFHLLSLS
jgi:hypothetical protein